MAEESERRALERALEQGGFVLSRAAAILGVSASTVRRRLAEHADLELWALGQNPALDAYRRTRAEGRTVSRQAEHQRRNRAAGLCRCGQQPEKGPDGELGASCAACKARANARYARRSRKTTGGAPVSA